MRRFWWGVWLCVAIVIGLVAGVLLTFATVIVPRSAELRRARPLSSLIHTTDFAGLINSAHAETTWNLEIDPFLQRSPWGSVGDDGRPFVVRARAKVPHGEQAAALSVITQQLMARAATGGYVSTSNNETALGESDLYWRQTMGYVIGSRPGVMEVIGLGLGEEISILIVIEER